jgi:hypothetical protein
LYIKQRQLLYYRDEFGNRGEKVTVDPSLVFENPTIRNAYIALQAWKEAILSDPLNLTANWVGSNVCNYTGVFCARAPDNHKIRTVSSIDLNHGDIAGVAEPPPGALGDGVGHPQRPVGGSRRHPLGGEWGGRATPFFFLIILFFLINNFIILFYIYF